MFRAHLHLGHWCSLRCSTYNVVKYVLIRLAGLVSNVQRVVRVSDLAVTAQLGPKHGNWVRSVSASPDDTRTIVCRYKSGHVKVWDSECTAVGRPWS